jgi:DegV family protein with EDD domain
MTRIRIITDSVADLPQKFIKRFNIVVVPVHVSLGNQHFLDDGTLDHAWFYDTLEHGTAMPSTAAPAPYEFEKAYQHLFDEGAEDIIGVFASASVSSIYNHTYVAAQQLQTGRVHIVDSTQVSMGLGWIVIAVAEAIAQGASVMEALRIAESMRSRTRVLGVLNSLEYLRRGGRVGWATARFGDLLQIKPIIAFDKGEAKLAGRVRTHRRAVERLIALVRENVPLEHLAIIHSQVAPSLIAYLKQSLASFLSEHDLPIVEVGPVFGAHIGPRCLGVAWVNGE